MNVAELCNREVIMVEQDATILEAAQLMRQYHVGNLVEISSCEQKKEQHKCL
jgi:predicted transcriptional regulator